MKKSFKRLTNKDFKLIKTLVEAKVSNKKIQDVTGRATSTIWAIKHTSNLAEYKTFLREHRKKATSKQGKTSIPRSSKKLDNTIIKELVEIKKILISVDTTLKTATEGKRSLKLK